MNIPKYNLHINWAKNRTSCIWESLLCPNCIIKYTGWDLSSNASWISSFYEEEISLESFVNKLRNSIYKNIEKDVWFFHIVDELAVDDYHLIGL